MKKFANTACSIMLVSAAIAGSAEAHAQTVGQGHSDAAAQIPPDPPEVLTEEEAAQLLRVDRGALLELASAGEIPTHKLGDGWRFSRAALLGWLAG